MTTQAPAPSENWLALPADTKPPGMAERKRVWADDEGWKLFDLAKDPKETNDVAAQHPDVVERLAAIATREFTPSEAFPIWRDE